MRLRNARALLSALCPAAEAFPSSSCASSPSSRRLTSSALPAAAARAWGLQAPYASAPNQRGRLSTVPSASSRDVNSLTSIQGVGEKSAQLLISAGIPDVESLQSWYSPLAEAGEDVVGKSLRDLVRANSSKSSKGGKAPRLPVKALVSYLRSHPAQEDAPSDRFSSTLRTGSGLTLCVEGNIGVGKTTFLQKMIGESLELQEVVEVVPEPVEKWQDVGEGHVNLLDLFYQDQQRYAYTFQHYVFVTRMLQEKDSRENLGREKTLRLLERSVFSDRMVFVRAVHEAKCMTDAELSVYDSWFSPMVEAIPSLIPDGFIYLRADPRTCLARMMGRARSEESMVSIDYLENLHQKHEDWLATGTNGQFAQTDILLPQTPKPPAALDYVPSNSPAMPEILRDKLVFLQHGATHSGGGKIPVELERVPALVLDYNINIDLENDREAQNEYARQVKCYMEYIKAVKDARSSPSILAPNPQLIMAATSLHDRQPVNQAALRC